MSATLGGITNDAEPMPVRPLTHDTNNLCKPGFDLNRQLGSNMAAEDSDCQQGALIHTATGVL